MAFSYQFPCILVHSAPRHKAKRWGTIAGCTAIFRIWYHLCDTGKVSNHTGRRRRGDRGRVRSGIVPPRPGFPVLAVPTRRAVPRLQREGGGELFGHGTVREPHVVWQPVRERWISLALNQRREIRAACGG